MTMITIELERKEAWGRVLYYTVHERDHWLPRMLGQSSLTEDNIAVLKRTGHFSFVPHERPI